MSQETQDRVNQLIAGFDARVQAASPDSWSNASPCEGWTARDVVAHVSNGWRHINAAMGAEALPEVGADDDIVASWAATRDQIGATLATADLSAVVQGPMGPMPAEQLVGRIMASDTLVHTWDLARAVGGDEQLPEEAVAGAYSGLKPMDAMLRRPGVFGARIDVPEGTDIQTEFLSFLGRKV